MVDQVSGGSHDSFLYAGGTARISGRCLHGDLLSRSLLLLHCETWMHFIPYSFSSVVKSGEFQGKVHGDANAVSDLEFWIALNSRLSLVIPGVCRVTRPP